MRKIRNFLFALFMVTTSTLLSVAPAHADASVLSFPAAAYAAYSPQSTVAALDCLQIGRTKFKSGGYITGYGSVSAKCLGGADLYIQWERWWGWDQVSDSVNVQAGEGDRTVTFDCYATGTHDFRTQISSWTDGEFTVKNSNVITVTC
jgi:hypothetical protein